MTYNYEMNYQAEITGSEDDLIKLERSTKDGRARDRVRFIRLLKTGKAATQLQAGISIGLGIRQSQRVWQKYWEAGIAALWVNNYRGGTAKLNKAGEKRLAQRLKKDDIASLEQARCCLEQEFGVSYTIGGVSYLFKRLKVKLKTGRPTNVKQDPAQIEQFKKKNIRL
jgi:transposase